MIRQFELDGFNAEFSDYVVFFEENEDDMTIYMRKPLKERTLGGGGGSCVIDKVTKRIKKCQFSR